MAFDITKRRALETAEIELVNGDGTPLLDDEGNALSVTVHGPGSKIWQQADAERNRRRMARIEKSRKRLSAALDDAKEDETEFLAAVTISFNGWEFPNPEDAKKGWPTQRDEFASAYADDGLGFIRDHVHGEVNNWSAFTRGSARS